MSRAAARPPPSVSGGRRCGLLVRNPCPAVVPGVACAGDSGAMVRSATTPHRISARIVTTRPACCSQSGCATEYDLCFSNNTGGRAGRSHPECAGPAKRSFLPALGLRCQRRGADNHERQEDELLARRNAARRCRRRRRWGFLCSQPRDIATGSSSGRAGRAQFADSRPTRGLRLEHRGRSPPGGQRGRPEGPSRTERRACRLSRSWPRPCITTPPWFSTR